MKNLLIIVATHGDERIGLEVINRLKKQGYNNSFDILIANPKALQLGKRFIDYDLNRAYPGFKYSRLYEKRRAFHNLKIAKNYKYVIDIHQASCGDRDFIIIARKKLSFKFPLELIDLPIILLWPEPKGPLSQILKNTIELEFGMKNRNRGEVIKKATRVIKGFIDKKKSDCKQKTYYVYGKVLSSEVKSFQLKEFQKTKMNQETFYPLLVNQYLNLGIACYKMKRDD